MRLPIDSLLLGLAVALGIGLLIGADRERRKGEGPSRAAAGLRTFTIAALAGAVGVSAGGRIVLAAVTVGMIALAAVSYWRTLDDDPGITTEVALILTTVLGGLAMSEPAVAAGLGAIVAGLLHARSPLHVFVRNVLSEEDVRDALILAGATLVVLPLLPDHPVGPYGALNLRSLWLIVLLVMGVSAVGYVSIRVVGARLGLPIAGLASGFISSAATIAAMGDRAAKVPSVTGSAVAGAVLSTVATIVQLTAVLAATSVDVLRALSVSLAGAGAAAVCYGLIFGLRALHEKQDGQYRPGRAFSLPTALGFALLLGTVVVVVAACRERFGMAGTILAAGLGGFADTHSPSVSVASLVASDRLSANDAVVPILVALSTNTVTKILLAAVKGGWSFAMQVIPGLLLVVAAAWLGALVISTGRGM